MSVYTLFPYQDEAIRKGLEVLMSEKQRREVLVAPVAAGKSIIIAEIVKRLPSDYKILVLQPNKELTEQNVDKIEKLGIKVAVYSASLGRKELGRVTYATPGSVNVSEFKKFGFNVALVDEADFSSKDGTNLKPNMEGIGIKNVLGLTATPIYMQPTMDGSVLKIMHRTRGAFFRSICHVVQIEEVRKENRWSELKYIEYEFDSKGLILNSTGADFTEESIITNYVEAGTEDKILSIVETLGEERALVFVPGIENVESLYKTLIKNGVSVGLVHSKIGMKDRAETLKMFRNNEIQVLINSLVLLAGYDDPSLENLIDAFPTNSARINYQKIGRIVRVGKKVGKVHCISGNYEKFGSIEDITFEDVENYGWGMFVKGLLVSGVPMRENIKITREDLKNGKVKTNKNKTKNKRYSNYDFVYQGNLMSETFAFGKYFGKTFEYVYERDKGYLFWMYKQIKENKAFQEIKHRPIRNKVIELYDKKLPF